MARKLLYSIWLASLVCLDGAPTTGGITRHVWTGVNGANVVDLTKLSTFPASPTQAGVLASFDAPRDAGNEYGARVFGWVHAPVSGEYRFAIHSDDQSELWLSTDESPDRKRKIAGVPSWVPAGQWNGAAEQISGPVVLEAGRYYYIEALHKEAGGGDHLGVGWTYPGQASFVYLPGSHLSPWQNVAPVAKADFRYVRPSTPVTIRVLDNDVDPNGVADLNPSSLAVVVPPMLGTVVLLGDGKIRYSPNGSGTGVDTFTYEIRDQAGAVGTATVSVEITDAMRLPLLSSSMPEHAPPQEYAAVNAFPMISFAEPLALAVPPGETDRLFVVEKGGDIEVIPSLQASPPVARTFLNLDAIVNGRSGEQFQNGGEQGLLGLAFHPEYAINRRFFVFYSVQVQGVRYQRLSEFAGSAADPNVADAGSEKVILQQLDDYDNHNGGDIHFGNDSYLYVSFGDEGDQNDAGGNSQRIDKDFWSSIVRIDVDFDPEDYEGSAGLRPNDHAAVVIDAVTGHPRYKVPADNPWVGVTQFQGQAVDPAKVRTEFWAVGLRNPWRFSFDRVSGELWCGDVGGGSWEEINRITRGGNYEWAYREGSNQGPRWNQRPAGWSGAQGPFYAYGHGSGNFQGNSVTGGVVYRGGKLPALAGRYVFADFGSGNIWAMDRSSAEVERLTGEGGIAGLGIDPSNGDVLMADLHGQVRRLVTQAVDQGFPQTLEETGLFTEVATLTPAAGLVAYEVNLPFWSDHAKKQRWFGLPSLEGKFGFRREGAWETPAGAVWVKHFEMEMERGNPASVKSLETRVLVRNEAGAYGVSYQWNEAGTQASLVGEAGVDLDLTIEVGGVSEVQRWRIPSRAECLTCHSAQAGHVLSFQTRQLNLPGQMGGESGNLIQLLADAGYLEGLDGSPLNLPKHVKPGDSVYSLEARARAWLEVNCSYCHQDGGTAPTNFDVRACVPLFESGTVGVVPTSGLLHPGDRLLVGGQEERSVLVHRAAGRGGYSRMPPLATSVVDEEGVQLLIDWVESDLAGRQSFAEWIEERLGEAPVDQQEAEADPDGDGRDNRREFLEGSNPLVGDRIRLMGLTYEGDDLQLSIPALKGRGLIVETSMDLINWMDWEMDGNDGIERREGVPWLLRAPIEEEKRFFRVRVEER